MYLVSAGLVGVCGGLGLRCIMRAARALGEASDESDDESVAGLLALWCASGASNIFRGGLLSAAHSLLGAGFAGGG